MGWPSYHSLTHSNDAFQSNEEAGHTAAFLLIFGTDRSMEVAVPCCLLRPKVHPLIFK